jgi:hypothetical protein
VLYVLRCGIIGYASTRLLYVAIGITSLVGALWWLNGHECIFASVIYWLADGDRSRPDILLPAWCSRWIMPVSSIVFIAALTLVLWRQLTHRWRAPPK